MAREISIAFALTAALGSGFQAVFQSAATSARNVSSAIREMERSSTGRLGASMAAQRSKIKGLAGSLKDARSTLAALKARAEAAGGANAMLARQIELAERRVNNLSGALGRQLAQWRNTTAEAATAGGSLRNLSEEYNRLSSRMERARRMQGALNANRARADALRNQRADLNGRLAGTMATAATVAVPVKLSIDFEDAIAQVGAVANASDEDLKKLTDTARQLGRDTSFSASQAAEGMKYLAMAGFDAKETIAAMPGMLDLAAAGNTDLGTTADVASDILSAFKLKADEMGTVSDTLAKTFTTSNTSLEMLGETMKYVGPVAASLGMSLQDTSAMAGMLGNVGIKASQAGTVLRAALLRLSAPPKMAKDALGELAGVAGPELDELYEQIGDTGDAKSALEEIGMTTKDTQGNLRPMVDILEELNMRTKDMGTAQKAEIFKNVFGTEASAGMIALAEQAAITVDKYGNQIVDAWGKPTNALRAYMGKVNDYSGTAGTIAQRMNATTGGALRRLQSAWEDTGISVGNLFLPAIQVAASALSSIGNAISAAVERFPRLSKAVALGVGGLVALTVGSLAFGLVMNTVGTTVNKVAGGFLRLAASQVTATATTGGMSAASALFAAASRIAGAGARFFAGGLRSILIASGVGAVLVGLGFAVDMLVEHWDSVVAAMSQAWGWVTDTWGRLGIFFTELGNNLVAAFPEAWESVCNFASSAKDTVVAVWNGLVSFFSSLWSGIINVAATSWGFFFGLLTSPVETVKNAWQSVSGFFSGLWLDLGAEASGIGQTITASFAWASDSVIAIWDGAVSAFYAIGDSITGVFVWARDSISAVWQGFGEYFPALAGGIASAFGGAWQYVSDMAGWVFESIAAVWNGAVEFFAGIVDSISGLFSGLFAWLQEKFSWVFSTIDAISGFVGKITGAVTGAWKKAFGEDAKSAAPAAESAKNNSAARNAAAPSPGDYLPKPGQQPQFKPVSRSEVLAAHPEKDKKKKKKAGSGSKKSGSGGGKSAAGNAEKAASGSGPVTVVTLAGDNSRTQTLFIPASGKGSGKEVPVSSIKGTAAGSGAKPVAMPATRAAQAASAKPRALPRTPAMLAGKTGSAKNRQDLPTAINVDLRQQFDLIAQDAAAVKKVLESIRPDMEALVRRALEKLQSDKRRTAYAQ